MCAVYTGHMTHHTTTPANYTPALGTTVRGPWNSMYEVSERTLAVNLASTAAIFDENDVVVVTAVDDAVDAFEDEDIINDGSIRGFWAWVWSGLDRGTQRQVAKLAEALLEAHRGGTYGAPTDIFEMFDGQR